MMMQNVHRFASKGVDHLSYTLQKNSFELVRLPYLVRIEVLLAISVFFE